MAAAAIATPSTARNPKPGLRFPEALDLSENLLNDAELPELFRSGPLSCGSQEPVSGSEYFMLP